MTTTSITPPATPAAAACLSASSRCAEPSTAGATEVPCFHTGGTRCPISRSATGTIPKLVDRIATTPLSQLQPRRFQLVPEELGDAACRLAQFASRNHRREGRPDRWGPGAPIAECSRRADGGPLGDCERLPRRSGLNGVAFRLALTGASPGLRRAPAQNSHRHLRFRRSDGRATRRAAWWHRRSTGSRHAREPCGPAAGSSQHIPSFRNAPREEVGEPLDSEPGSAARAAFDQPVGVEEHPVGAL